MKKFVYLISALSLSACLSTVHANMQTTSDNTMMDSNTTPDQSIQDQSAMDQSSSMDNSAPVMTTQETTPAPTHHAGESTLHKIGGKINDAAITTAISAKYAVDPLLGPFSINVTTTGGMVNLSGTVDSKTQYERAMAIASSTNGVASVDATHLMVTPSTNYTSDAYTTSKVKAALLKAQYFSSGNFNSWNIHVETNNGTVYLTGQVQDEMAKTQVLDIVKNVEGVNKVEADLHKAM